MIPGIGAVVSAVDAGPLEVNIVNVAKNGSPWEYGGQMQQSFIVDVSFSRPWPGGSITIVVNGTASGFYPPVDSLYHSATPYRLVSDSYAVSFQLYATSIPGITEYIVNPGPFQL